jgi:hypothetical protein
MYSNNWDVFMLKSGKEIMKEYEKWVISIIKKAENK